jgi:hypothetical protein
LAIRAIPIWARHLTQPRRFRFATSRCAGLP